jgi:hypothetical protein
LAPEINTVGRPNDDKGVGYDMTRPFALLVAMLAALSLGGCSWFGGKSKPANQPVLTVGAGQCFESPSAVHTELTSLQRTSCSKPHALESYARVGYKKNVANLAYPGSDVLTKYAQSVCAQEFNSYVGIDYQDSSLFFTYLLPSPQGWEQNLDRFVLCFIESNASLRTTSAKGSKQ